MKDEALRQALDYIIATNKNSTFWLVPQSELNKTVTAIKQALEQSVATNDTSQDRVDETAKQRHEPEPVAWVDLLKEAQKIVESKPLWKRFIAGKPLANDIACWMADFAQQHTSPPKREWQGLTDDEIWKFWWSRPEVSYGEDDSMEAEFVVAVRRILAAHGIKEKNT